MEVANYWLTQFKNKLLNLTRPQKNSIYNSSVIAGVSYLTKLRLTFSMLNEHKFRHNFDSLTPLCACGMGIEYNEHFFLHCSQFHLMHRNLFGQLSDIAGLTIDIGDKPLCELLLLEIHSLMLLVIEKFLKLRYLSVRIRKGFPILFEQ